VMSLRLVDTQRWTKKLTDAPHQGRAARALQPTADDRFIARSIAVRTELSFNAWNWWHKSRMSCLPVLAPFPGPQTPERLCRHGCAYQETTAHVISGCEQSCHAYTRRHDAALEMLEEAVNEGGSVEEVTRNRTDPEISPNLRPDLLVRCTDDSTVILDVAVSMDDPEALDRIREAKREKYQHLGLVLPLALGALGAWDPRNDDIARKLGIPKRVWHRFQHRTRLRMIEETCTITSNFFGQADYREATTPQDQDTD